MRCKVCGCTEERACVTEDGPCHWAAPELCSACVSRLLAIEELKEDVIGARLTGVEAFMLLSALQLVCRHPQFQGGTREFVEQFARGLQERISRSPAVAELCERGWDSAYDVPIPSSILLPGGVAI